MLLCGTGRPFAEDASLEGDLRSLARVLFECLPPSGGDSPGALEAVLDRVLIGEGFPTAAAFAEAIAAAVTPAPPSAVAARAEASQPEGTPAWLSRRRALAQALRAEEGAAADEVGGVPVTAPVAVPAAAQPEPPPLTPSVQEPPLRTPPPLPAVRETPAPVGLPSREDRAEAADRFYEDQVANPAARPAATPVAFTPSPSPGWSEHPRAPLLVAAVAALLGLAMGLGLGGR